MAEPINLNRVRKAREKQKAKAAAAQNRIRFGRSKAENLIARLEAERARRDLEGKKRED